MRFDSSEMVGRSHLGSNKNLVLLVFESKGS